MSSPSTQYSNTIPIHNGTNWYHYRQELSWNRSGTTINVSLKFVRTKVTSGSGGDCPYQIVKILHSLDNTNWNTKTITTSTTVKYLSDGGTLQTTISGIPSNSQFFIKAITIGVYNSTGTLNPCFIAPAPCSICISPGYSETISGTNNGTFDFVLSNNITELNQLSMKLEGSDYTPGGVQLVSPKTIKVSPLRTEDFDNIFDATIDIVYNGTYKPAEPYIYGSTLTSEPNTIWNPVMPYIYINGSWHNYAPMS